MALFLVASYVYKAIKKKKDQEKDLGNEIPVKKEETPENTWGLEGLIQEFEATYGTAKPKVDPIIEQGELSWEDNALATEESDFIEYENSTSESDPQVDKMIVKEELKKTDASKSQVAYNQVDEVKRDFDIREMVIGKIILDRPEY